MYILRAIIYWGWNPFIITALAIAGHIYEWPIEVLVPALSIILIIGLVIAAGRAREKELELLSLRLRQAAGYFYRRFMGDSSLSIFTIIDSLFNIDDPKLWDWARACDQSQRIFNAWGGSFVGRVEKDVGARMFGACLHTYLTEMWLVNNHYYEFVEQFYEVATKVEIPQVTISQYNVFVMEYNTFVQDFQDIISELRQVVKTQIEPPSVKLARELVPIL